MHITGILVLSQIFNIACKHACRCMGMGLGTRLIKEDYDFYSIDVPTMISDVVNCVRKPRVG